MKIINDIYLLTGEKLISVEKLNGHNNIFYFENNIRLTGKDFNRKTYILIKCSITGELIKRKYNEKFLYKKIYLSPSASVSGERNGMHGKGYLLKGHKVSEETKKKLSIKASLRRHTEEEKRKISESMKGEKNPFYGKHHTEETKKKWSEQRKGKNCGEKNPFYRKHHTEETKKRIVENYLKWRKENPEEAYQKSLQSAIKSLKSQNRKKSSIEIKVETYLKDNMIDYQYQYVATNYFIYDFFLEKYNCLIEVQGDYWHGYKELYNEDGSDGKKKLKEMQKNKIISDKRKKKYAETNGYIYIDLWEHEINNNDFRKIKELCK